MADRINLWRSYPTAPFERWACSIEMGGEDGVKIVESDPGVCDPLFLAELHNHYVHPVADRVASSSGGLAMDWVYPGTPEHFHAAARTLPGAFVGPNRS
jgi:hypothetical protein